MNIPESHLAQEAIAALVDGELAGGPAARAARHLTGCAQCRMAVQAQREAKEALHASSDVAVPGDLLSRLRAIPFTADVPGADGGLGALSAGPGQLTVSGATGSWSVPLGPSSPGSVTASRATPRPRPASVPPTPRRSQRADGCRAGRSCGARSTDQPPDGPCTTRLSGPALSPPPVGTSAVKGMAHSRDSRSPGTATSDEACSASLASRCACTAIRHWAQPARWRAARAAGPPPSSPSTRAATASWARWLSGMFTPRSPPRRRPGCSPAGAGPGARAPRAAGRGRGGCGCAPCPA